MAVVEQWRGELDDTPFDVPNIGNTIYNGLIPPRLVVPSGTADSNWKVWTFPVPLAALAFRCYLELTAFPLSAVNLVQFGTIARVRVTAIGTVSFAEQPSTLRATSPALQLGKEYLVEVILRSTSWAFRITEVKTNTILIDASTSWGPKGTTNDLQIKFNGPSLCIYDNIQINDDASKFIGFEREKDPPNGDPMRDYEFFGRF